MAEDNIESRYVLCHILSAVSIRSYSSKTNESSLEKMNETDNSTPPLESQQSTNGDYDDNSKTNESEKAAKKTSEHQGNCYW